MLAKLMQKGIAGAAKLFERATWRTSTLRSVWKKAERGPNGGRLCSTCGKEAHVEPGTGPRDWHGDHYPKKWGDIVNEKAQEALEGKAPTRVEMRDLFNDPNNVRLRCPECNLRDNKLSAVAAGGVAIGGEQARPNIWRDIVEGVIDFIVSPSTADAPELERPDAVTWGLK